VDMKAYYPNCLDASMGHFKHMEDVSFTYKNISCTHELAGKMSEDDWTKPKA